MLWVIWFTFRIILVDTHYYGHYRERLLEDDALALVSLPIGLVLLFLILGWVLDGFAFSTIEKNTGKNYYGRIQPEPPTYGINYINIGRALGEIFVKPDVWAPEFDSLTEYNVSPAIAALEMAFVRVAILKRVVPELRPGNDGDQIRSGITAFVDDVYSGVTGQEIKSHYKCKSLVFAARSAVFVYEKSSESVTQLASEFADRLTIPENRTVKIVPMLDSVYDEARRLMRLSQSYEKL